MVDVSVTVLWIKSIKPKLVLFKHYRSPARIVALGARLPEKVELSSAGAVSAMASAIKSGALVSLEDLVPSSPFFANGSSLRVIGRQGSSLLLPTVSSLLRIIEVARIIRNHGLQEYSVETAFAIIVDGRAKLKVSTVHLRDLSFRVGSIYQFIGELRIIQPENEATLQARVGRNVDGIDLNLYHESIQMPSSSHGSCADHVHGVSIMCKNLNVLRRPQSAGHYRTAVNSTG
ncbi:hypothetical protein SAY86_000430 [Trapa natans]|uniref:Uncharacterized protein n=1 Tax=Trapa natans TaxID=22666 RepID=A0AAN7MC15_TRANT|nr:hypothetical protein SAY86_000430 [Trapa natans]